MDNKNALQELIDKLDRGESTPEEELAVLRFLNQSVEMCRAFIKEIKIEKLAQSIQK